MTTVSAEDSVMPKAAVGGLPTQSAVTMTSLALKPWIVLLSVMLTSELSR